MREPLWPRPDAARTMEIVMRFALLAALVMACVSTGAQAQSLACDAFAKNADGSWTALRNVGVGVAILMLNIVGWILALALIGIPLAIGTWIWGLVDAHQSAQRWNREHGIIS